MIRTRVGYTGGSRENPTYNSLGDHTESVQVDYDPEQIGYQELLAIFWDAHSPRAQTYSQQYMNAVFYHDEEQKRLAEASKDRIAAELGEEVFTQILPARTFYLAENYHQKYNLRRHRDVLAELKMVYPTTEQLIASTAAARINGYLGSYGTRAQLEAEIDSLGLSTAAREKLLRLVR